ncbi:amidohydrolase family protein [Amphibiibacter pelophylacis]|uniref:Amidohydrolase family protein n=1 Tax=Amphibiibacter pelophylacis TaxID=1799477 RepID=A0ACC6P2U5_9BURK
MSAAGAAGAVSGGRIDAHQHFWPWRDHPQDYAWMSEPLAALRRDVLPHDSLPLMQAGSIAQCLAVQARATPRETAWLLDLCATAPQIAGVIGWDDLRAPDLPQRLAAWRAHPQGERLKGLRHQVQDEADVPAFIASPEVNRGLRAVQDAGLVYSLLVRHGQMAGVPAWAAQHDRHWLVLDHLGKPPVGAAAGDPAWRPWEGHLRALAALPHVAAKLSGLATEATIAGDLPDSARSAMRRCWDIALDAFGAQRLMFGSDWPVLSLATSYADNLALFSDWTSRLSAAEQSALWQGTARRVYGLSGLS